MLWIFAAQTILWCYQKFTIQFHVIMLQVGWIALHCAASEGHVSVARLLLDRGSDVNIMDKVSNDDLLVCIFMLWCIREKI